MDKNEISITSTVPQSGASAIQSLAERRSRHYRRHHRFLWDVHVLSNAISSILVIAVPVALLAMVWMPEQWRKTVNIITLAGSGFAAILAGGQGLRVLSWNHLTGGCPSIRAKALSRTKISWAVPKHRLACQRG